MPTRPPQAKGRRSPSARVDAVRKHADEIFNREGRPTLTLAVVNDPGQTRSRAAAPETLEWFAAGIRTSYTQAMTSARDAVAEAFRCGTLLVNAKALLSHGEWLPWLAENTELTPRTAQRWMQLAQSGFDPAKAEKIGEDGIVKTLKALGTPKAKASPVTHVPVEPSPGRQGQRERSEAKSLTHVLGDQVPGAIAITAEHIDIDAACRGADEVMRREWLIDLTHTIDFLSKTRRKIKATLPPPDAPG